MAKHSANNNVDSDDINADNGVDKSATENAKKRNYHRPLALTSPKQLQGSYFERQACDFLQKQGLVLIVQNWQQPKVGELDLIMLEVGKAWPTLVFIEVRQRKLSSFGDAALSVTASKQRKVIKTAKYFLQQHPQYADYDCRFDVIAYDVVRIANIHAIKDSSNKNDSLEINSLPINNDPINNQPEWLIGAFIAMAW